MTAKARIRWFVWTGGERIAKVATMRGRWPGYDAECSCGWGSHTGGAIETRVREAVQDHLLFDHGIATGAYKRAGVDGEPFRVIAEQYRAKLAELQENSK